jgi:hypothetical protein
MTDKVPLQTLSQMCYQHDRETPHFSDVATLISSFQTDGAVVAVNGIGHHGHRT